MLRSDTQPVQPNARIMIDLLLPDDFAHIGGPAITANEGFTLLALHEKGALIRLDRDFPNNPEAKQASVIYAAVAKNKQAFKAIRLASMDDRLQKFRRPAHMDALVCTCCEMPCRYLSIYDDGSGTFFDMDVPVAVAFRHKVGALYHYFFCEQCGTMHTLPIEHEDA